MPSRFVSLTVTPGVDCKVILPPCSALTLSNAALAAQPKSAAFGRCVLECDLATHSFVVCSLLTTGVRQAAPEITITNDPDEPAWFFLKASGPHSFHSRLGGASDMIEVLLPSGDEALGFEAPSDADSEEFIEYMQARQARKPPSRAAPTKAAAKPSSRGRGAAGRRSFSRPALALLPMALALGLVSALALLPPVAPFPMPASSASRPLLRSRLGARTATQLTAAAGSAPSPTPPPPPASVGRLRRLSTASKVSVASVLLSTFLNLLGFTLTLPVNVALREHFELQMGASFGSLSSAYPLGTFGALFLWPRLSDRVGRRPSWAIYSRAPISVFLACRFLTGCCAGAGPALLADIGCATGQLPRFMAWRDAATKLALLAGPRLEGKAAPADGIVACPLGTRLVAAVATVCAVSALYNCGSATYAAFFGPLAQDLLGLGIGGIGRAYTALACLSFAVSAGGSARVQGTIGTVATCALGLAAVGASLLLMGAATLAAAPRPSLVFWAGAALYQLGTPLYAPTVPTMLLQCVPRHRRGAVMGLDEAINTAQVAACRLVRLCRCVRV
ncbi:hypothetical protein EMIHUDRAFT_453119 [Emiliania huxleyi CCMP1516]|uniref:Nucleoplasmin-like domain-containing protein n=2 Tax=Emiliania huxleyi TaxID=2903 RepID=A0A0D3IAW2_EMIH1|nr:hypothetical protein EMIHUDRAFT_453119 [Emiliania huxleyi CCMP1516]EOD08397.1 hypothetical protein EMIHUDRAFT_453119 [Emiliania huxleyi CCMP1516]|eukprot:XP_005760826.1 hypothetical protein EMIHUDRAFT_453119 [Emiliania huxleyi CCMP1516]